MARRKDFLGTTALVAAAGLMVTPALAGTLPVLPMIDSGGGGYVYIDLDEGTAPPGLHAVTENVNGAGGDIEWTGSQGGQITNCVRASVPDAGNAATGGWAICNTGHHSGKRIKLELTGKGPTDIRFNTEDSGGITEYYYYGKTWNRSGARALGYEVQLGTGTGIDVPLEDGEEVYDVSVAWHDTSKNQWFWGNLGRDKITSGSKPDPDEFVDLDKAAWPSATAAPFRPLPAIRTCPSIRRAILRAASRVAGPTASRPSLPCRLITCSGRVC